MKLEKKDGQDICQVHANILYDIQNRTYQDCLCQPKSSSDERKAAIEMLKNLDTDNTPYIVTMDRGYSSFNMFETCNRLDNCFYCIHNNFTSNSSVTNSSVTNYIIYLII